MNCLILCFITEQNNNTYYVYLDIRSEQVKFRRKRESTFSDLPLARNSFFYNFKTENWDYHSGVSKGSFFILEYNATSRGKRLHFFRRSVVFLFEKSEPSYPVTQRLPQTNRVLRTKSLLMLKSISYTRERNKERFTSESICKKAITNQCMLCEFRFRGFYDILTLSLDLT